MSYYCWTSFRTGHSDGPWELDYLLPAVICPLQHRFRPRSYGNTLLHQLNQISWTAMGKKKFHVKVELFLGSRYPFSLLTKISRQGFFLWPINFNNHGDFLFTHPVPPHYKWTNSTTHTLWKLDFLFLLSVASLCHWPRWMQWLWGTKSINCCAMLTRNAQSQQNSP